MHGSLRLHIFIIPLHVVLAMQVRTLLRFQTSMGTNCFQSDLLLEDASDQGIYMFALSASFCTVN